MIKEFTTKILVLLPLHFGLEPSALSPASAVALFCQHLQQAFPKQHTSLAHKNRVLPSPAEPEEAPFSIRHAQEECLPGQEVSSKQRQRHLRHNTM